MKKRVFILCLSVIRVVAMLPIQAFAASSPATGQFTDVGESDFFYDPVVWAVGQKITTGTTTTTFSPSKACTRAESVTFLWRAFGCPEPTISECPFTDISEEDFYYKATLWACEKEITSGVTPTTFAPNDICSRSQIVTFLYRAKNKPVISGDVSFSDVPSGAFYESAVKWAAQNAITTGTSPTQFSPDKPCTRGEVVTFLYRTLAKDIDWNFLYLIIRNTEVSFTDKNGNTIHETTHMPDDEIDLLKRNAELFEADIYEMSDHLINPHVTVAVTDTPLKTEDLTYSESLGYYLEASNAYKMIPESVDLDKYDHVTAFADSDIEAFYWGLGGTMLPKGTGFSFIKSSNSEYAMWAFDENSNWAPGVVIHEFLHFMESWSRMHSCPMTVSADSGEALGYTNVDGFKSFYADIIKQNVHLENGMTAGTPCGIWRQPPHSFR